METNDRLIFLISTAQHLLKMHLKKRFDEEDIDVSPAHMPVLFLLEKNGPMMMNQLSDELYIENSTVTGLVDRLENKGYVIRNSVDGDRRKWHVSITQEGKDEIGRAGAVIKEINDKITDGFPEDDVQGMKRVLSSFFEKFV